MPLNQIKNSSNLKYSPDDVAGLVISISFCHKINKGKMKPDYISEGPIVTIYKNQNTHTYIINIIVYIPTSLKDFNNINLNSDLTLNKEKYLLNYNGVSNIDASIHKPNDLGNVALNNEQYVKALHSLYFYK